MLLAMLVAVFKSRGELAEKRADLYQQGIRCLIKSRVEDGQVDEIEALLQQLGHEVHVRLQKRDFTDEDVMECMDYKSRLWVLKKRAAEARCCLKIPTGKWRPMGMLNI